MEGLVEWLRYKAESWDGPNGVPSETVATAIEKLVFRVSLRILPSLWVEIANSSSPVTRSSLPLVLRTCLLTEVGVRYRGPDAALRATRSTRWIQDIVDHPENANLDKGAAISIDHAALTLSNGFDAAKGAIKCAVDSRSANADKIWDAIRFDLALIQKGQDILETPLWNGVGKVDDREWGQLRETLVGDEWAFWVDWYDNLLEGNYRNFALNMEIASIESETWNAGIETVNPIIQEKWQRHSLLAEVRALRTERDRLISEAASVSRRSHNNPPELVEDLSDVSRQIEIIWVGLDEAKEALEDKDPDKTRLRKIGQRMRAALIAITDYSGRVANTTVMAAAKVGGAFVAAEIINYLVKNLELMEFIRDLITFAGG